MENCNGSNNYKTGQTGKIIDDNFYRYVGFDEFNSCVQKYFSPEMVKFISDKVTQLTMGVHPENRPIMVPEHTISSVLSSVYNYYRPQTGDIYSRYIIPDNYPDNMVQRMLDQTIQIIVDDIRHTYGMMENNSKLTVWTTLYGDFNKHGLRQHAPIPVRVRRPNPMEFNMNY